LRMNSNAVSRREVLGAAAALAGAMSLPSGAWSAMAQVGEAVKLPIGMNLAGIADWEPGYPFLNVMWGAREWITRNAEGQSPWNTEKLAEIELDAEGYPVEIPAKVAGVEVGQTVMAILPNTGLPGGEYVLLYDGEGEITGDGRTKVLDSKPGRLLLELPNAGGDGAIQGISIKRSKRGNQVRNIRIVPLASEKADLSVNPFRPEFLEFCKPWHALRFMDWLATNGSINREWSKRKTTGFYTQRGSGGDADGFFGKPMGAAEYRFASGVALELCILASNLTKSDCWLCVPHRADDEYIRKMAEMTREKLDPGLKVYCEFSNEIWNWQFPQAQWMLKSRLAAEGVAKVTGKAPWKDGVAPTEFPNDVAPKGSGVDHPERTGALFRRCFAIWEDVFKGADRTRRGGRCGGARPTAASTRCRRRGTSVRTTRCTRSGRPRGRR
jgi:hypothetical protein